MKKLETTKICPQCGSGKVDQKVGLPASCMDCGWLGDERNLVETALPTQENVLDISEDNALSIAKQISHHLLSLLAGTIAKPMGNCLIEAGLVSAKDTKNLARLLRAGCSAAHQGILQEADAISTEYQKRRGALS